jgi:5-methylcytosine-specific restriction endonuclease McrA
MAPKALPKVLITEKPEKAEKPEKPEKAEKTSIPKALREQVWITHTGRRFETKCLVPWCTNIMTVFDFHVGHDIPESRGGATEIANLKPICARCNLSMGSSYTIHEWASLSKPVSRWWICCA